MTLTVQQILQKHLDDFVKRRPLAYRMLVAARRMRDCRTAALGGRKIACPNGHVQRITYNSCRHRSCPQCSLLPRERWLDQWKQRLLDCPHYHVIFTTPHELVPLWRYNKRVFADALFAAASQTLLELLDDSKYLGGRVGLLAALHTWSQTLASHVHLHVLVTGGGLDGAGQWLEPKKSCLLPRKVLMIVFRGKLRAFLRQALAKGRLRVPPDQTPAKVRSLLNRLGRTVWNVKILDRYAHGRGVATYLAHYLRGGPLSNQRLVALRDGRVHFRYRVSSQEGGDRGRRSEMNLATDEFLARLLEHVPPRNFQTVRGYGLYAGSQHHRLDQARKALGQKPLPKPLRAPPSWEELCERLGYESAMRCPECGAKLLVQEQWPAARAPPAACASSSRTCRAGRSASRQAAQGVASV